MNSIEVVDVGKAYRSYPTKWGRAAEWMGMGQKHQLHWVLRDVNLEIAPGESVGLIGMNGAGKSTLLKIIAGVTRPTTGVVNRTGRLAALLELGMGFHPEFPGRQNVFMAGQLQGLSADVVQAHMGEIEEFAEIGEYIDEPVRTYSSGMQMRLAFSIATAVRPDVLIVDEALAVGDIYFQQKCFERLARFRQQGTTLLLVSHSIGTIVEMCDRAVFLRAGNVAFDGSPKQATDMYQAEVLISLDKRHHDIEIAGPLGEPQAARLGNQQPQSDSDAPAPAAGSLTSGSATFLDARTYDDSGKETQTLFADTVAELRVRYRVNRRLDDPHVGFKIRNRFGAVLFETNSYCMKETVGPRDAGDTLSASFRFTVLVAPGDYTVTVGLANRGFAEGSFEEALSFEHDVHAFTVVRPSGGLVWMGAINLRPELSIVP